MLYYLISTERNTYDYYFDDCVFIVLINSLEKLLWTCLFWSPMVKWRYILIHWPRLYITIHIWTQKTVIYSFNYQFWKNNWIGAQQIGSKYEDMVFIDWYTFWNSDPHTSSKIPHIYGVSVVICGGLPIRLAAANHHKPRPKRRKYRYAGFGTKGIRESIVLHRHGLAILWRSHILDKLLAFYQHTNNHHPKFWWWFAVVCSGLQWFAVVCLLSSFTAYRPKFWWWFVVVCGYLWWFVVVWGGLPYSHTG